MITYDFRFPPYLFSLYPRKYTPALNKGQGAYTDLPLSVHPPSINPSVHPSVSSYINRQSVRPMNIVVAFFSGTTLLRFSKFGFRIYISQLYRVVRFQIHHSITSYLPKYFGGGIITEQ